MRREPTACPYRAYVPDRLAERTLALPTDPVADLADANQAIAALQPTPMGKANTESVARLLIR